MAENERTPDCENGAALKEAVCIDAMRIYDSCSDKDCLEDLRVLFPASVQPVVDASANVRVRDVDVISVYIDMPADPRLTAGIIPLISRFSLTYLWSCTAARQWAANA